MDNYVILEDRFDLWQKFNISILLGGLGYFMFPSMYSINHLFHLSTSGYTFLLISSSMMVSIPILMLLKWGLIAKNGQLYRGSFLFQKPILKKLYYIDERPEVAVLKFRRNIESSNDNFNRFDVYLLNERHTQKDLLFSLKSLEKAYGAVDFLEDYFPIHYATYDPRF